MKRMKTKDEKKKVERGEGHLTRDSNEFVAT